jgi:hypothetical protein
LLNFFGGSVDCFDMRISVQLEATFGLSVTQPLGFPPKKWIGATDPDFVQKRKQHLQGYLTRLTEKAEIVHSTAFLNFIQVCQCAITFARTKTTNKHNQSINQSINQ